MGIPVETTDRSGDRVSILLVDDLPDKLLVLRTILEGLDLDIIAARSGEDALRLVLKQEFAVILLDINLPGMDGLETAAYIRGRKKSAHTPIIFITAYHDDEQFRQGYSLGAVDYIFTPVVPEVLRSKVKVLVDLYRMTQQARRHADERVALAREQAARAAAEETSRRLAFLAEAGTALAESLDSHTICRTLAARVVPFLADLAAVYPVEEAGRLGQAALASAGPHGETDLTFTDAENGPFAPYQGGIQEIVQSGRAAYGIHPDHSALHAVSIVPLVARGRTLGVLAVGLGPSGRSHSAPDITLLEDVAARAATALENARLYQNIQQEHDRKTQFLAMLAHELRNPLAPIRTATEILGLVEPAGDALVQARDIISRQAAHLSHLVDDLLDVSRLARGKILLRKQPVDLVRLVRDTTGDYHDLLSERSLRLTVDLPDRPVPVLGDATRLSQIIGNLLHNASKFTDPGGQVGVELRASGNSAVLAVRDSGIGMEPEMLSRVFDAFTQVDGSLDRARGGLGLGLALVRGLIELHDGEVRAESAGLGLGTRMVIRLPLIGAEAVPADPPATAIASPLANRVLVIEDNADAAESMRILLAMTGHEVQIAHAGLAGLEAARWFHPQIVVCDIGLPGGMDGYDVARAMRRDRTLASIRLIALSGYGQEEDRRRSRQAGFDDHLIKPVEFAELRRLLASS